MNDNPSPCCVLLPCSSRQSWVVPQRCLGEIVTVAADVDQPPAQIDWRGESVPVVDFGREDRLPWRDPHSGAGLVAVMLGQRGEACQYFAVAVRGSGLGVSSMAANDIEDLPDAVLAYSTAAFRMGGSVYQVPDLLALQRAIGAGGGAFQ